MSVSYFFGAAAGGFILMAAVGIQALAALFSSIPLTKRHRAEHPGFKVKKAYRRITQVVILVAAILAVATALVVHFASTPVLSGYLAGMLLALVVSWKRLSPNHEHNQKSYEESYADCYPPSDVNPDDLAEGPSPEEESPAEGSDKPEESGGKAPEKAE